MSGVDNRVVNMKFDNSAFERGVSTTLGSLARLKESMNFSGASKGLTDLQGAAGKVNLGNIDQQTHGISASFIAMSTIAITALSNITSKALAAGSELVKSFTVAPISAGLQEYEATLNSTQTLMSGTGESVEKVTATLKSLNDFSDRTIYSFSDMTKNITAFTNAGMKSGPAAEVMMGIANASAAAGINAEQASRAMVGFGQSMSMGFVGLQDWMQVEGSQIATKEFKNELIKSGLAAGTLKKSLDGTVRTSKGTVVTFQNMRTTLKEQWLEADVLTATLDRYSDTSTAVGKKAAANATRIKTLSQMMDVLKESAQSGWSSTWLQVFGNLEEAAKLWTGLNDVIGGFIGRSAEARNKVLGDWKTIGGRAMLIESLKSMFQSLFAVMKPIGEAFREIFPRKTGQDLMNITFEFKTFVNKLKPGEKLIQNIKDTFRGFFALISIGVSIVKGFVGGVLSLFGVVAGGSGSILSITGGIGKLILKLKEWLDEGDKIAKFFSYMKYGAVVIQPVLNLFGKLSDAVGALIGGGWPKFIETLSISFSAFSPLIESVGAAVQKLIDKIPSLNFKEMFSGFGAVAGGAKVNLDGVGTSLDLAGEKAKVVGAKVKEAFRAVADAFVNAKDFMAGIGDALGMGMGGAGSKITDFVKNMGIEDALAVINTGFFIALYIAAKRFMGQLGNLVKSMNGVLNQLTSNLKSMQMEVRADAILKIAAALAVLTASIFVLSTIDAKSLTTALAGIASLLIMMTVAIKRLEKDASFTGGAQLVIISAALIALGISMLAFAAAVKVLGSMKVDELQRGLLAIGAILAGIVAATAILGKSGGGLQIMAAASALAKLAFALLAFAGAIKLYAAIDTNTMKDGGLKIAAALAVIGLAMSLMPPHMLVMALGLLVVAGALHVIAGALKKLGAFTGDEMSMALNLLGRALITIAAGLTLMYFALPGAIALTVFAAALHVLTPALIKFGAVPFETIKDAMKNLLLVFAAVGIGSLLLIPATVILLAFGAALGLFGLAALAAGAGILLLSTGLAALAVSGAAGIAVLTVAVISIAQLFPLIMHQIGLGLMAFAKVIEKSGPKIMAALSVVLDSLLQAIINNIPKFGVMLSKLIQHGLKIIRDRFPDFVKTGYAMLTAMLEGLRDNLPNIVRLGSQIIRDFMKEMGKEIPKLIDSGMKMIIEILNGTAKAIEDNSAKMREAGGRIAIAIIDGLTGGLGTKAKEVTEAAVKMAKDALGAVGDFLGISSPSKEFAKLGKFTVEGFVKGLTGSSADLTAGLDTMRDLIKESMTATRDDVKQHQEKLNRLLKAKKPNQAAIKQARKDLAESKEEYAESVAANKKLQSKEYIADKAALRPLAKNYDKKYEELEKEKQALKDLVKAKEDYRLATIAQYSALPSIDLDPNKTGDKKDNTKAVTAQFSVLPAIDYDAFNKEVEDQIKARSDSVKTISAQYAIKPTFDNKTTLENYKEALKKEAETTEQFRLSLAKLRTLGVDDETYSKILADGKKGQHFIDELIESGASGVQELNALNASLAATSTKLGQQSADDLAKNVTNTKSSLSTYISAIQKETLATEKFKTTLSQLRAMGMDTTTYNKLLADGTKSQPFLDELLASGQNGIATLNSINAGLANAAAGLGAQSAADLAEVTTNTKTSLGTYLASITDQTSANQKFAATLAQLRAMGMDQTTYGKLVAEGVKVQPFLDELLASGSGGIATLNTLNLALIDSAKALGGTAADEMHNSGIKMQESLILGIEKDLQKITNSMKKIADRMLKGLKKALGMKSPSRELMKIGRYTNQGLAIGLDKSTGLVIASAERTANQAVDTIKATMSGLTDAVTGEMNVNPVIAPVLDLTQVQKDASRIDAMVNDMAMAATVSYDQASTISADRLAALAATAGTAETATAPTRVLEYTQNNYSPKALSPVEIYRQTKNQLSLAKEALNV